MILAPIYGSGLCFQERRNTLHGSLIPTTFSLLLFSALCGEQEIAWKPLTLNDINILVLASALRMGVLKEVDKTYMKK